MDSNYSRRAWLILCVATGAVGVAGCLGDDDDTTENGETPTPTATPTPDMDDDPPRLPVDPDSYAYDIQRREIIDGEWTDWEVTSGIVVGDHQHETAPDGSEVWVIDGRRYSITDAGNCSDIPNFGRFTAPLTNAHRFYRPYWYQLTREPDSITEIDGFEVEVYLFGRPLLEGYPTSLYDVYIEVDTGYWIGVDAERYDEDSELIGEDVVRFHSFNEFDEITLPAVCQ